MRSLMAQNTRPMDACANNFANTMQELQNIQQLSFSSEPVASMTTDSGNVNHRCAEQVSCLNDLQASSCVGLD